MKNDCKFIELINDSDQEFSGWDFSYVSETGRIRSGLLSWSYGSLARELMLHADSMLDMGAGGGELLAALRPFPRSVFATEGYEPNIAIAKERLEPLGASVVSIDSDTDLPFHDQQFDLVINRHESFSAGEVRRIIEKNGVFLTQQVGGLDCKEINDWLGVPLNHEYENWNLATALEEIENNRFEILYSQEEFPIQRFYDVGALVYYLKAIPWQVPDFSTEFYLEKLYAIHQHIQSKGYFDVKQHRFIIKAKAT